MTHHVPGSGSASFFNAHARLTSSTGRHRDRRDQASRLRRRRSLTLECLEDRRLLSGEPQLLKDVNLNTRGAEPVEFAVLDDALYFRAYDRTHGYELWRSDGTEQGTSLLKDIVPGVFMSDPLRSIRHLTAVNDMLYFSTDDGVHGRELWRSDGTAEGTVLVKDINPGG